MKTRIRKIGNSYGVILPKELINELGLKVGDNMEVYRTRDQIKLEKEDTEFSKWAQAIREGMEKYEDVLRELAK